jgi:hypothetical protein
MGFLLGEQTQFRTTGTNNYHQFQNRDVCCPFFLCRHHVPFLYQYLHLDQQVLYRLLLA